MTAKILNWIEKFDHDWAERANDRAERVCKWVIGFGCGYYGAKIILAVLRGMR